MMAQSELSIHWQQSCDVLSSRCAEPEKAAKVLIVGLLLAGMDWSVNADVDAASRAAGPRLLCNSGIDLH